MIHCLRELESTRNTVWKERGKGGVYANCWLSSCSFGGQD